MKIGLISSNERDNFLNSIHTVSQDFTSDAGDCAKKKIKWSDFVRKYGHLRPGTYDITSPSYKKDPQSYLKPVIDRAKLTENSDDHKENTW